MSCELSASDLLINQGREVSFEEAGRAMLAAVSIVREAVERGKTTQLVEIATLEGTELVTREVILATNNNKT